MRKLDGLELWLGHAGGARDLSTLLDTGIVAVVDLAIEESTSKTSRELVHLRFPLHDGVGNPRWMLQAAVDGLAGLIRSGVPTFVHCGAGMSRTPAIVGAAIAQVRGLEPGEGLRFATRSGRSDVSPALWADILTALNESKDRSA